MVIGAFQSVLYVKVVVGCKLREKKCVVRVFY